MQAKEVSVAPGEVSGRMVLGRMVLGIDESGSVVSEGRVSGEGARPPVVIEPTPSAGVERENRPGHDSRRTA